METKLLGMKADIEIYKEMEILRKNEKQKFIHSRVKDRLKYVISKISSIIIKNKKRGKSLQVKNNRLDTNVLESEAKKFDFVHHENTKQNYNVSNITTSGKETDNNKVTEINKTNPNIVSTGNNQMTESKSKFLEQAKKFGKNLKNKRTKELEDVR